MMKRFVVFTKIFKKITFLQYERDSFLMSDGHLSADEGCMYSTDDDEDDVETKSVIRRPVGLLLCGFIF
jgi:hypothetical protein